MARSIRPARGLVCRRLVAQERDDVAGGGEAEAHHLGIFGGVDEFVDRAGVETVRPIDRDFGRAFEFDFEAGGRRARIGLALAHADLGMRGIEVGGGIAQRGAGRIVAVVEDEILAREPGDAGHDRG